MLREIEASACKWEHVRTDPQTRRISLFIPVSRMDQTACGVKRIFAVLWTGTVHEVLCMESLFLDKLKKQCTETRVIDKWRSMTCTKVTGHSARRSGAMEHVRQGLQTQELAFLGRWKSAVVLTYANDALQEMPANNFFHQRQEAWELDATKSPWTPCPMPRTPMMAAPTTPKLSTVPAPPADDPMEEPRKERRNEHRLWVSAMDKKGKKIYGTESRRQAGKFL